MNEGHQRTPNSKSVFVLIAVWALTTAMAAHAQPNFTKGGPPAFDFTKTFSPDTIGPGSVSTLNFFIQNTSGASAIDIAFTDSFPAGVTIANPSATTDCPDAILSAPTGGTTISMTDGRLAAGAFCNVSVDVTSSAMPTSGSPVVHMNVSGILTSSVGSGGPATDDLTIVAERPGFTKSFSPSTISPGQTTTLTLTIDNTANPSGAATLSFSDFLPAGMVIASPSGASTDCGNATFPPSLNAVAGTSVVSLFANGFNPSFPALAAGSSCSITLDVTVATAGAYVNTTQDLIAGGASSGKASAVLDVPRDFLAKSFIDDPVPPGGTVTLEFAITNFDRDFSATDLAFTDDLAATLAGLTYSSLLFNDCGGAVGGVGTTSVNFSGGTLAPQASCTIRVSLSVPAGAAAGSYLNTTNAITATIDSSPVTGNMATDFLQVVPAPSITKQFMGDPVNPGDPVALEFTLANTSTTSSATDIAFEDIISTVLPTASATPGDDCCGAGSTCTFTPLFNPSPPCDPCDAIPARITISGGTLAPAGMTGDSCTFSFTLDVTSDAEPGTYPNTTSDVTATVDGATRVGRGASDDLTVIAAPTLSKAFTDDPVTPGGTVTLEFTLELSPNSPTAATGITFTDNLAALTPALAGLTANLPPSPDPPCGAGSTLTGSAGDTLLTLAGGTLMPGESCLFSVTLNVPAAAASDTYTNTTSGVSATVLGAPVTSAPAIADLTVSSLQVSKEFIGDPALPGDDVTLRFTIEKANLMDDVTSISFTDSLSSALSGLTAVAPLPTAPCGAGSLITGTTFLIFVGGNLGPGVASCVFDLTVRVPGGAADGTYVNTTGFPTALVNGAGPIVFDPASDGLDVNSTVLSLTKAFTDDPVSPGDPVTLEFILTNLEATRAASAVGFTDDLDTTLTDLTFDSVLADTCGGIVGGTGTTLIDVSGVALGANASCLLRVSLTVPAAAAANVYTNTTSTITGLIGAAAVSGAAATDSLEVIQLLDFSKSFDGPTTATGTAILTFTITNPGTETADNLAFSDDLDNVITGLLATSLPAAPCGVGSAITGTSVLIFTGGELAPLGGTCSFDVEVTVPASATGGTFLNATSVLLQNGLKVSEPATANLIIEPPPTFAKAFSPDTILAGGVSTLTLTIDNSANTLAASGLGFTDSLPAGVVVTTPSVTSNTCGGTLTATAGAGTISLTGGSVGAGATCTIEVNVTSIVSGAHVNTTGDLTSSSGNSGTATDTLTVNPAADLSVTKSDGVTSATPGGSVTYTIVVANAGPSADPSATLSDTFPSPPLTCTYTSVAAGGATGNTAAGAGDLAETLSLPVGGSVTYTVSCGIDSDATGTLSNTATVTPSVTDLVPGNNSATDSDTTLVPSADLAVTKTDGVTSAVPGQSVTYTIVASNNGPSDDPAASLDDTFPSDLTCTYTSVAAGGATGNTAAGSGDLAETLSLPAGSSVTYTVTCTIDSAATGTLSNTATITASVTDPTPGNNSATDDDTVLDPEADLSVTKTDGVTSAVPGQTTLTYTIVASNAGPSDDPAATLTDVFPADLTCTWTSVAAGGATGNTAAGSGDLSETLSLPSGSSVTYTGSCTIDAAATGTLSNTATITASVTDPAPVNNSATDDDTVLAPEADMAITKDGPMSVTVGDTLAYTLVVTNNGPSDAANVEIDDPTPTGLVFSSASAPCVAGFPCDLGDIALGDSVNVTVTFDVPFDYSGPNPIENTATVTSDAVDNTPANNSATAMTTVILDVTPPTVTDVSTAAGPLAACDTLRPLIGTIQVTIEDDLAPILGADDPLNYLLLGSGPDGDFSTAACGAVAGDDVAISIVSLSLMSAGPIAVADLGLAGANGLDAGLYRFFVCDTITDAAGNALVGDFEVPFFRADPLNLFMNGHFDDCPATLDPWIAMATPPNAVQPGVAGTDDFVGSPLSASAQLTHSAMESSSLAQCVPVEGDVVYDLQCWARFEPPMGALAAFVKTCEFFDTAACAGASLGETSIASLLEDNGGAWSFSEAQIQAPAGAASALCIFEAGPLGSELLFDLYLDGLFFSSGDLGEIFADGFESGDTTAWSSTEP